MKLFKVTMSYHGHEKKFARHFARNCSEQIKLLREYLVKSQQSFKVLRLTVIDINPQEVEVLYYEWRELKRLEPKSVLSFDGIEDHYPTKVVLYFDGVKTKEVIS